MLGTGVLERFHGLPMQGVNVNLYERSPALDTIINFFEYLNYAKRSDEIAMWTINKREDGRLVDSGTVLIRAQGPIGIKGYTALGDISEHWYAEYLTEIRDCLAVMLPTFAKEDIIPYSPEGTQGLWAEDPRFE